MALGERIRALPACPAGVSGGVAQQHPRAVSRPAPGLLVLSTGASCGDCAPGFALGPDGGCVEAGGCQEADRQRCEAEGRRCAQGPPVACGACLPGRLEDPQDGSCRLPVSCEELDCGELGCLAGEAGQDARCGEPCDQGQLFNGERCVPCPRCDRPERGEDSWPVRGSSLLGPCPYAPSHACDRNLQTLPWISSSTRRRPTLPSALHLLRSHSGSAPREVFSGQSLTGLHEPELWMM